ncbi:MAG: hypothetical protein ACF8XB_23510, partial [Planctomycetota bacterium JB042]
MTDAPRSPRRFVTPIRRLLLLFLAVALIWGLRNYSFVRLPEGPSPLFDFAPGAGVVVHDAGSDRPVR